jgi:hypothetical protein
MEDQVTSIEQSKRLIELGVPASRASMMWIGGMFVRPCNYAGVDARETIPAFTVIDLLEVIKPIDNIGNPTIEKIGDARWIFEFGEFTGEPTYGFKECQNIVELLVDRIEWVVSNGYELNLQ